MNNKPAIFIATSKRFYSEAEQIVLKLKERGHTVYHPYFNLNPAQVDADPDFKRRVTIRHFSEIDQCDIIFALLSDGYIGCSVTIEITYAYAKNKQVFVSEPPAEHAILPMITEISPVAKFITRFDQE